MEKICYTKPSITQLEIEYANDAVIHGWGENCYKYIGLFENKFSAYVGCNYAIATSSCTGALHLGLAALGIGPGDEVILADTNWIASVAPIVHCGAKPIFVDILPDSWCIDPELVENAITPKTKAILAVHLYGNLCDMDRLLDISTRYNIPLIEDAAEAIGSKYKDKIAGSMGCFATFSFHGTKTLTTGEGGMFVTNDLNLYLKVQALNNHGRIPEQKKQFWPELIGYKFKMSNVQAAIGYGQIQRVDDLVKRKIEILNFYRKSLVHYKYLSLNPEPIDGINGAWMPTVVFNEKLNITRDMLVTEFSKANIDARVFFWPLSSMPMFEQERTNQNPIAKSISNRAINLPSFHDMTDEQQLRVISVLDGVLS